MFRLFKKSILSADPVDKLLAFLPDLESGRFRRAMGYYNKNGENLPQVEALREALLSSGLVHGLAWKNYLSTHYKILLAPGGIARMPAPELQTVITAIVHTDRLAEGFLAHCCQSNLMTIILRRIKLLHSSGELASVLR